MTDLEGVSDRGMSWNLQPGSGLRGRERVEGLGLVVRNVMEMMGMILQEAGLRQSTLRLPPPISLQMGRSVSLRGELGLARYGGQRRGERHRQPGNRCSKVRCLYH